MKHLLLLSLAACLTSTFTSCQYLTSSSEVTKSDFNGKTTEAPVAMLTNNKEKDLDTLVRIKTPSSAMDAKIGGQITLVDNLRRVDESTIEPAEMLIELGQFSGKAMEESLASLFLLDKDTLKLYVDYFDGDLTGSKVFYIANGALLAVDVLEMEAYWTEGGQQIKSVLTHSFYYKEKELLHCKNHHYPERQILLEKENTKDWAIIRQSLQLL